MEEVSSLQNHEDEPFKVLEFYSGIGGMRYSLMKAGIKAQIVQAFEINDVANDVYHHNFGHRPYQELLTKKAIGVKRKSTSQEDDEDHIRHFNERNYDFRKSKYSVFKKDEGNYFYCYGWKTFSKGNIQSLTASDLDKYQAHAWLLSPPCQPYTRQGLQKDSSDARAFSFLNILDLIPQLSNAPLLLLIENVVGFETSKTHNKMTEVLAKTGYLTQEFILSPLQFGVPYSRPRYFCLAKMKSLNFQYSRFNNQLLYTPSSLLGTDDDLKSSTLEQLPKSCKCVPMACKPVQMFLEFDYCSNQDVTESRSSNDVNCSSSLSESAVRWDKNVGSDGNSLGQYFVPLNLIERWGSVMDIVYPDSKRCCCFTKSYYRYVKGTGSLLATIQPKLKGKESPLEKQGLRYFTPREVANLHSFPKEFCFPEHVSLRQRYALLGNSLSVAVVAPLLSYLFSEPDQSV